jgi:Mrp family chromosome partitioning ATPase
MSRLYKALQRAEEERGVRLPHTTLPVSKYVPAAAAPAPVDDSADAGEYERLKVMLAATRGEVKTTLLVSALQGEGVSTVTMRLAKALAGSAPMGVLVIDLDAPQRTISRWLGARQGAGLAEVMAMQRPRLDMARADAIAASSAAPGLYVLGPGRTPVDLAHAQTLSVFEELVAEFRLAYDYVLIDGGALEHAPAAAVLAPRVDSALLVVEAERSNIPAVRAAADELRGAGANLLGAVLNRRRDYVPAFVSRRLS